MLLALLLLLLIIAVGGGGIVISKFLFLVLLAVPGGRRIRPSGAWIFDLANPRSARGVGHDKRPSITNWIGTTVGISLSLILAAGRGRY